MEISQIPDTATETYLEHLESNIVRQLKKTKNKKIKAHLQGMLQEVRDRLKEFRQKLRQEPEQVSADELEVLELTEIVEEVGEETPEEAQEFPQEPEEASVDELGVLELTDIVEEVSEEISPEIEDLTEKEQEIVKDRLKEVVEKFQDRKQASPQKSDTLLLEDIMQEVSEEAPLDTTDLSESAQEKIKNRLKGILGAFQAKAQESTHQSFIETLTKVSRGGAVDEAGHPIGEQETVQFRTGEFAEKIQKGDKGFQAVSTDEEFIAACEKVSQGLSPALFDSIGLSDRERDLVSAFIAHLSTYKGLKKQQAFEMQHLTARSIHELDLIFKTYKIQGYLRAGLANVYNRLLNLRSRFSILLN